MLKTLKKIKISIRKLFKSKLFFVINLIFGFFLVFLFLLIFLFVYYGKDLPVPEKFTERQLAQSTKIYDRSGKVLLYEIYGEEKRTWVPLKNIPDFLIKAVLAAEDVDFYNHVGIDIKSIARSILINLKLRQAVYGGSTISQQLIRSTFLDLEKSPRRKIREIILTLELERRYSKDQILEWYLNQIPLGQNSYGVEAAAQTYFQKSVSQLTLPEAATIAAIIQAPSFLSPYGKNKESLLNRKNLVLDRMVRAGFISAQEAEKAKKEEVIFVSPKQTIKAPHFSLWVKDLLVKKYGEQFLKEKGLKIYTTLDWDLQVFAEKAVKNQAQKNVSYRAYNAALVAINPNTGEILSMVGSKDWFENIYPNDCKPGIDCLFEPYPNIAFSLRQPGSAFKPFVYITAFEKGYTDKSIIVDEPSCWPSYPDLWCPKNFDGFYRGPVTLRQALAQSLNIPAVKVLDSMAGIKDSIKTAEKFGITTLTEPSKYGLSLVLGGAEVKLIDMVSAYGVFATEGLRAPFYPILKIEDPNGNIIEENKSSSIRVVDKKYAQMINDILSDNQARAPVFGLNSPLYTPGFKTSVKTGTTQDFKDGWVIGYDKNIVVGVWAGNNNSAPMSQSPGVFVAAPIWKNVIEYYLKKFY
jgi:1A family penicillin-binding protein